jgi:hypothetical protein
METFVKYVLTIMAILCFGLTASFVINRISSDVVINESWHMQYYKQFADGYHSYYDRDRIDLTSDGYTPLASQIYGWTIRYIKDDIRVVRFVSFLFGLGSIVITGLFARKLSNDNWIGLIASGLICLIGPVWYIEAGPNVIHLFFSLLGAYLLYPDNKELNWTKTSFAMLAFFLSYWAKQTGIIYLAAALFYIAIRDFKKFLVIGSITGLVFFFANWYFATLPDSNFLYLVYGMNRQQPIIWNRIWNQILPLCIHNYGIFFAICLYMGIYTLFNWKLIWKDTFACLIGGAAIVGFYASCKYGSGLSQAWFLMSLMIIYGMGSIGCIIKSSEKKVWVYFLILIQFFMLFKYTPAEYITKEDKKRFDAIIKILSIPNKETFYINSGYHSHLAGKKMYANISQDCWDNKVYNKNLFSKEVAAFLDTNPWDIVIIDEVAEDGSFKLYEMLQKSYKVIGIIPADSKYPRGGRFRYKKIIYERK